MLVGSSLSPGHLHIYSPYEASSHRTFRTGADGLLSDRSSLSGLDGRDPAKLQTTKLRAELITEGGR